MSGVAGEPAAVRPEPPYASLPGPVTPPPSRPFGAPGVNKKTKERIGGGKLDVKGLGATADQEDYNFYSQQEQAQGRQPISFEEWRLKKPPSTKIDVNNGGAPGQDAFTKKSAEYFAEDYQNMRKSRSNARQMIQSFDSVEKALNEGGFRTGFAGDAELSARKALKAMGFEQDADKLAGAELVQAFGNRMSALMRNPESGMGMPGSVSDRDLQFLKESNVGLNNTEPGNKAMVQVFRRMEQRKVDVANMADEYVKKNGQLDAGFDQVVADFAEKNSLLEGIDFTGAEEVNVDDLVKKYLPKK